MKSFLLIAIFFLILSAAAILPHFMQVSPPRSDASRYAKQRLYNHVRKSGKMTESWKFYYKDETDFLDRFTTESLAGIQ